MASDIYEQLTKYLTDAHSIEEQALAQLRDAPDAAGDPELARAYREHLAETEEHERLADDERAMMARLESSFDRAVEASVGDLDPGDVLEQLRKYLADAHAIEEQAAALLERGTELAGSETLARIYEEHLDETRDHA